MENSENFKDFKGGKFVVNVQKADDENVSAEITIEGRPVDVMVALLECMNNNKKVEQMIMTVATEFTKKNLREGLGPVADMLFDIAKASKDAPVTSSNENKHSKKR